VTESTGYSRTSGSKESFSAHSPPAAGKITLNVVCVFTISSPEVEFTNFPPSRVYLGFLKSRLESRFQEVEIHQFRAKNAT
jgi:hypothetical protein